MSRTMTVVLALAWTMAAGGAHAAMQKGDAVQVASNADLKTRPMPDAESLAPAPAGATATLSVRITNTSGHWWYVEVDGKKGWLPESALVAPAAAPPEPAAAVAPEPPADVTAAPAAPLPEPAVEAAPSTPVAAELAKPVRTLTAAGSREIAGGFEYFKDSNDLYDLTLATIALKYGVCITDAHELGVDAFYARASTEGYASNTYTIGPFYALNLPSPPSNIVPYFGIGAGISRSDDDDGFSSKGTHLEASAGVRVFVSDDFAVNVAAYFRKSNTEADDFGSFDLDSRVIGVRVGLSGFLR